MRGCFKNFFAMVGCFVLFLFSLLLLWVFWPQITDFVEERFGATEVEIDSAAPEALTSGYLGSGRVGEAMVLSPTMSSQRWVG